MSPSPERWRQLEELYRAAVEHPPDQRATFLREACPNEDLRRELESLLHFERVDDTLLQHSAWAQSSGLAPGMRLGVLTRSSPGWAREEWVRSGKPARHAIFNKLLELD